MVDIVNFTVVTVRNHCKNTLRNVRGFEIYLHSNDKKKSLDRVTRGQCRWRRPEILVVQERREGRNVNEKGDDSYKKEGSKDDRIVVEVQSRFYDRRVS